MLFLSFGFVSAQNLFFTDSYQTNLYQADDQYIIFNNNAFGLIDEANQAELIDLFETYFEELNLPATYIESSGLTQIKYQFSAKQEAPLMWSKLWHTKYEVQLKKLLTDFLRDYYTQGISFPESIADAALKKQVYYTVKNYRERTSDYIKTSLHIALNKIDLKPFLEDNLAPNLSLSRIVTNSFLNYYNEAYPIMNLSSDAIFLIGPSSKARLKDCVAMHLFAELNQLAPIIYLTNHSVLVLDSLSQNASYEQERINNLLPKIEREMSAIMNNMDYAFYNVYDKESLSKVIEEFNQSDYEKFLTIYIEENSYNMAYPIAKLARCYNKSILESTVEFKTNSHQFNASIDSLTLNALALFVRNNNLQGLVIIGYAGTEEYTKIDRAKFAQLVEKYKDFTPVKSSKKADLSIYRAVTVFDYLVQHGVDPSTVTCMSKTSKNDQQSQKIVNFTIK